jgi:hypothetical protein
MCDQDQDQNEFEMKETALTVGGNPAYKPQLLQYDLPRTGRDFMLMHRWTYPESKRWMGYGFQGSELARIFDCIPHGLRSSIDELMKILTSKYHRSSTEFLGCAQDPWMSDPRHSLHSKSQLGNIWCDDQALGICVYDFDAGTQERLHARTDSFYAASHGMHEEEYGTRLACHDLPLHWTDLEFLIFFVYSLRNHFRTESMSLCERVVIGSGDACRGLLVREELRNTFDSSGRVTQVIDRAFSSDTD